MKTKKMLYPVIILSMILISSSVFSQGRSERKEKRYDYESERSEDCIKGQKPFIPDLTDDQKESIKNIKINGMKEIQPLENKIGEKEARLRTLTTGESINYKDVDATINEIFELKAEIFKKQIRSRQMIKELLTDEQKVVFDKLPLGKDKRPDRKHGAIR